MTINELIKKEINELKINNVEEPILKLRMILAKVLNKSKEFVMAHGENILSEKQEKEILEDIEELKKNVPIQYIIKNQEFMKLNFYVDENVLIPRSDTEVIVEEIINTYKNKKAKILDLCTGSGCIAVSLKKYIPSAEVYASDISVEALNVAKLNAKDNGTEIKFIESDMFKNIKEKDFDIIVSNPPYIKSQVIEELSKEVQKEPIIALDGGDDGLYFYKKIVKEGYQFLNNNGMIFLEIGFDQKEDLLKIINEDRRYELVETKKDLANNDRLVVIRKG